MPCVNNLTARAYVRSHSSDARPFSDRATTSEPKVRIFGMFGNDALGSDDCRLNGERS